MRAILIAAALLTTTAPVALAQEATATTTATATPANAFERDRQSILAQAGQYRVHFDMRENVSFRADYNPLEEKLSGGSEIVRVVYDKGDRISLQHILVMEHEGQVMVIKHWRHDWVYQPQTDLCRAEPVDVDGGARGRARRRLVTNGMADRRFTSLRRHRPLDL